MTLAPTFFLIFVAGPLLFAAMSRQVPGKRSIALLWAVSGSMVALAWMLQSGSLPLPFSGTVIALFPLVALWLAWIAVLALCVLAVRARVDDLKTLRWVRTTAAMATTLPWFGLYAAKMMSE